MNGAQHYAEAERILALVEASSVPGALMNLPTTTVEMALTRGYANAQVHATLALAAATMDAGFPGDDTSSWTQVLA